MKKIIFAICAAAMVVASCAKHNTKDEGLGRVSMKLTYGGEYITKAVDVDAFQIEFSRSGEGVVKSYLYGEMPAILELPTGTYTVTASSSPALPAAFEQPVYGGSTTFRLSEGQLVPITLNCTISNMKVSIRIAGSFEEEIRDYKVAVTNSPVWSDEANVLIWKKEDVEAGKAGFFSVAPLSIKVDGYRISTGKPVSYLYTIPNVAAADHHIITIGAITTGTVEGIQIVIDDKVNDKNVNVNVPGFEEVPVEGGGDDKDPDEPDVPVVDPDNDAPSLEWEANPNFDEYPIEDVMDVNILIKAPKKIKSFKIAVDSYVLSSVVATLGGADDYNYEDGPYVMDLIGNETLAGALGEMGVPTGDQLKGQTEVLFSLSSLVPMIKLYSPDAGTLHKFALDVTDEEGQNLSKELVFVAQ